MGPELIVFTIVLLVTVVLFAFELLPVGQTAMLAAVALVIAGVTTGEQLFAGFANEATITVGAMFVVSAALFHTGALDSVGELLAKLLDRSRFLALLVICLGAGTLSAFVNNTTVVAIMIPLIVASARDVGVSASRLLMPLSFAAMLGGTCTLIGTSTNLIVGSVAEREGLAPISMFELAPVGLVLFAITVVYLLVGGRWLVPERREVETQDSDAEVRKYVVDLRCTDQLDADARLDAPTLLEELDCELVELWREGEPLGGMPGARTRLHRGDLIRLRCTPTKISELLAREEFRIATAPEQASLGEQEVILVEVLVGPNSPLIGRALGELDPRRRFDAVALGLRRSGELQEERLAELELRSGDLLLLAVDREGVDALEEHGDLILVSKVSSSRPRNRRMPIAIAALVGVVAAAASGVLSIAVAATAAAVLVVATGCVRLDEAVEAVDWNVMLLLAGVLSLGAAMTASGAAAYIAEGFVWLAGGVDIRVAVALLYLGTALLTSVLSNNATAALLTPVAIDIADQLGVDARPLVMAIAFGASAALLTPVGYQTNTMVYGAGRYRFSDYARVGGPLMLLLIPAVAFLVPIVWPP